MVHVQVTAAVLSTGLALSLALSPPAASAAPTNLAAKRQQDEQALQEQVSKLEYLLQQQQTAAKAEILGK